ncbi:lysophospholipid acyltransferase family protein [Methylocapsa palsarum]|uniref:1-acyl-sn-glycerol-3-phosphate acyltransferase n=1 Tax=Methylocapsa palsarum TaxID=1612308 RepID=A0A1I4ACT6_9HYPH|nr:lysophospholipid acyltransferase family protein [Methylocapsa palsarum]SFK54093.1 1-acyl-sn-glycerol-3-phosphate acyltransferase [Methylocapsa palsarum]
MQAIRSILFHAAFYSLTTLLAIFGLPILLRDRRGVQAYARFWTGTSIWLLDKVGGVKVEFRGLDRLPQGGCIIAAKHQSALETLALTTITHDFSYVLKRELMGIPIFGWYLSGAGQIAIDRAKRGQAMADLIKQVGEAAAQGRQIFIFPEGTRRQAGAPPDYKSGVAHLYAATGAICAPVALNTGLFWPRSGPLRSGTAVIEFLPPLAPGLDKKTFANRLQTEIEAATAALIAEAVADDPGLKTALAD